MPFSIDQDGAEIQCELVFPTLKLKRWSIVSHPSGMNPAEFSVLRATSFPGPFPPRLEQLAGWRFSSLLLPAGALPFLRAGRGRRPVRRGLAATCASAGFV